ncbi:hypothetical protein G7068_12140 [Leucobacter viscericola]|uniref:Uncharacterized protein n=1 Tax=Leucobacter viscericola TaxID=2714935 RepID=A0A6G7XHD4_9MICO|nr:hypothetical protein [Leucobacter viscericola]QIK63859.1 hypothetical protein G7068_12140 [Leucobacter viscericola]
MDAPEHSESGDRWDLDARDFGRVEVMSASLRIFQTHDAAGEPAPAEFVQTIVPKNSQPEPEALREFMLPLRPSRTSRSGVYFYDDPARGSGRLKVVGASGFDLPRVDEMVHLMEINRKIGMEDPARVPDVPGWVVPFVISNRSPWVRILVGLFFLIPGFFMLSIPLLKPHWNALPIAVNFIFGMLILLMCAWSLWRDVRRLPWWVKARAQAKRDGGPLPEELRVWS